MTISTHADSTGYRSYEVYQRVRPGETTERIRPRQLRSREYLDDPYPILAVLREHYPCYRDWPANAFWVTRYDDVTSIYVDEANFESRSRAWTAGLEGWGRDLAAEPGGDVEVLSCLARVVDEQGEGIVRRLAADARATASPDLATQVCARLPFDVLCAMLAVTPHERLARWFVAMQRAWGWHPVDRAAGRQAAVELASWVDEVMAERRDSDAVDLISIVGRRGGCGRDVVATVIEMDHSTSHGILANLWFHLLTSPDRLRVLVEDRSLVRAAVLEAFRHSPTVITADRWTRGEVERFGRLLPAGALVRLSAAAANRDPRVFTDPDAFEVHRRDLCQREPRGQYRADGLPSGISFGTGAPSRHPAVPEDRPRSRYALTRDLIVAATHVLLDELPTMALAGGASPTLRSLRVGEIHTCWSLPIAMR
jgi:pulcherriminic acid synthase